MYLLKSSLTKNFRYYHKGAFFADNEDVQNKDYSGATGEDLIDKSALPKVMQVRTE